MPLRGLASSWPILAAVVPIAASRSLSTNFSMQPRFFRDVADESGVMHVLIHFDFGDAKLDRKQLAVFSLRVHRSDTADGVGFAGSLIARDIIIVVRGVRLFHEQIHLLPYDLVSRITKNFLRRRIE